MRLKTAAALCALASAAFAPAAFAQEEAAPESEIFDNWLYTCEGGACQSLLALAGEEGGRPILSWAFVHDRENDRTSMVVTLPHGVALPPGLRISLAEDENVDIPFQVCDGEGCRAVAVAEASLLETLGAAETVSFRYLPYGAQAATAINAPMKGFSRALARLKAE